VYCHQVTTQLQLINIIYACLSEAKASFSQRTWAEVSSITPHFLHNGLSCSPKR